MSDKREHWTVKAQERAKMVRGVSHPRWGLVGVGDDGEMYVPVGFVRGEEWWEGRLNRRNPWHWLPYLRSRITRRVAWIECR